ncbi:MAG: 50S ribosomal protein L10 [Candidatus Edwardsbacteria bacterium]
MPKLEKENKIEALTVKFKKAKVVYLTDFTGLNVAQITELRKKMRQVGIDYQVTKNTFASLAARQTGYDLLVSYFDGPTGLVFGVEDPIITAKVLLDFIKLYEKPKIKAGFTDGRLLSPEEIKNLSTLPSKTVLLSQVVSGLQAPLVKFVGVLQGILRNFLFTLEEIRTHKVDKDTDKI